MFAIQRFEQFTDQDPDRVAIVDGERAISYRSLDENSNRLTHYLIDLGIGPGSLVCTHLPPAFDLIVAILAIAKTGAAFLTIDPQLPEVRKRLMVDDCEPDVLITSKGVEWVANGKVAVVDLNHDFSKIKVEPESRPTSRFVEGSLSYLFYTSGSTGDPKAVMVPWRAQPPPNETAPYPGQHDRHVLKSSPAFTLIVREIFQPITSGGRVYLLPDESNRDPDSLLDIILAKNITLITVVPSVLRAMLASPKLSLCRSLRFIDCIGEALSPELRIAFQEKLPVPLGVTYGCTEASSATLRVYNPGDHCDEIDLGKPLPNRSVYVLDEDLHRVAKGKTGQIFVGGKLAIGYFKQPRLTAERFIPDLYSSIPGTRMYGTGDQGRFSSDGSLIYEGRGDDQVQINGQRVEPTEVEKVIAAHQAVEQAVVVASGSSTQPYLGAFVVARDEGLSVQALREHSRSHLPNYMVPTRFLLLDALPLLPSGKLDRGKLRDSLRIRDGLGASYRAPTCPEEKTLVAIWERVLRVAPIGIDDDFFELGGESITAMQIQHFIDKQFAIKMSLVELFDYPSISEVARLVRESQPSHSDGRKDIQHA